MQTSSHLHSLLLPSLVPFSNDLSTKKISNCRRKMPSNLVLALGRNSSYDKSNDGRLVDENMVVLRMRIRDMKMEETMNDDDEDSKHWMEWEKKYYYGRHNSDISEAVGLLQNLLMETRPSLALGMLALVLFSVPTSLVTVFLQLMEMAKSVHMS